MPNKENNSGGRMWSGKVASLQLLVCSFVPHSQPEPQLFLVLGLQGNSTWSSCPTQIPCRINQKKLYWIWVLKDE